MPHVIAKSFLIKSICITEKFSDVCPLYLKCPGIGTFTLFEFFMNGVDLSVFGRTLSKRISAWRFVTTLIFRGKNFFRVDAESSENVLQRIPTD